MPLQNAAQGPPDLEQLTKRHADAAATLRELTAKLATVRATFARQDELVALSRKLNEAIQAKEAKVRNDPKVAEAQQAVTNAAAAVRKACDKLLAATPEYAAMARELGDLDKAMKKLQSEERLAQTRLSEMQRKMARQPALEKLAQAQVAAAAAALGKEAGSPEVRAATRATNAYAAALRAKTAADPQGAELIGKLNQLATGLRTNATARRITEAKMSEWRYQLLGRKDKVIPARQAEIDANFKLRLIVAQQTEAETEAMDQAEKAYQDALEARFAADPSAAALRQRVAALSKEVSELAADIRLAQRATNR